MIASKRQASRLPSVRPSPGEENAPLVAQVSCRAAPASVEQVKLRLAEDGLTRRVRLIRQDSVGFGAKRRRLKTM